MYRVRKRDGELVDFNINKISGAIKKAFEATGLPDALPDTSYAEPDGPSPKDQYQELYDILF